MTLLEAIVALVIASGILGSTFEIYRQSVNRSATARLSVEATLEAESQLARVSSDIPLRPTRLETNDGRGRASVIAIRPVVFGDGRMKAFEVISEVVITRGGTSARARLATLKLEGPARQ